MVKKLHLMSSSKRSRRNNGVFMRECFRRLGYVKGIDLMENPNEEQEESMTVMLGRRGFPMFNKVVFRMQQL